MAEEYCEGIKILIARMETNPEDFELHGDARFLTLARTLEMGLRNPKEMEVYQDWNCLHKREQDALLNAYKEMGRRRFSQGIMQTLLEEEKKMEMIKPKKYLLNTAQVELMKSLTNKEKTQYLEGLKAWTES